MSVSSVGWLYLAGTSGTLVLLVASGVLLWACRERPRDPELFREGNPVAGRIREGRYRLDARYPDDLEPGDYFRSPRGRYLVRDPDGLLHHCDPGEYTIHHGSPGCLTAEPARSHWRLDRGRWVMNGDDEAA